jgi:non-specific serine/threonine protein kinase
MGSRAHLARQEGRTLQAMGLLEEALALFRAIGDPRGIANSLANLGHVLVALGQPDRASPYFGEALDLRRSLGNTLGIAECLEGFATAAAAKRQARQAARLLGAAAALREMTGASLPRPDREQLEGVRRRVEKQLSPQALEREHARGRALVSDRPADYALLLDADADFTAAERRRTAAPLLSNRERQVAVLVAQGLTNREIAETLSLTRRTIGTHLEHIFAKLGVQARAEVAVWITRESEPQLNQNGPAG